MKKTSEVFIHSCIRIVCQTCNNTSSTPMATSSNAKIDQIIDVLNNVKSTLDATAENVKIHREETKTNAKAVAEMKSNKPTFASFASSMKNTPSNINQFPPLNRNHKRKRTENTTDTEDSPKKTFRHRKLVAGTGMAENHGLGSPVKKSSTQIRLSSKLTKSIYISRLSPSVKTEQLRSYITSKLNSMEEGDIDLRLLVKKDQNLEDLTFISYRLLCTEIIYQQLMESSFWPSHVFIGEFVDKPRPPRIVAASLDEEKLSPDDIAARDDAEEKSNEPSPNDSGNTEKMEEEDTEEPAGNQ